MTTTIATLRAFDLNAAAARVHLANAKWWLNPHTGERIERNPFEILALVHSELSEALEGERKSKMDDHLPHRPMAEVEMADTMIRLLDCAGAWSISLSNFRHSLPLPGNRGAAINVLHGYVCEISVLVGTFGTHPANREFARISWEIDNALHSVMSYCAAFDYDLLGAYEEKMAYNATRADHTLEARRAAGGKAF